MLFAVLTDDFGQQNGSYVDGVSPGLASVFLVCHNRIIFIRADNMLSLLY